MLGNYANFIDRLSWQHSWVLALHIVEKSFYFISVFGVLRRDYYSSDCYIFGGFVGAVSAAITVHGQSYALSFANSF